MANARTRMAALFVALTTVISVAPLARASISDIARADLDAKAISVIPFDKLQFQGRPGGPQSAVVFGDPDGDGMYGIILKWPPHTGSRPHIHLNDRYIIVLSGTWWVGTGPKYNPNAMSPVRPGEFVTHYAGQIHYDGARDEPAMIYIVGKGPQTSFNREEK